MSAEVPERLDRSVRRWLENLVNDVPGPVPLLGYREWAEATDDQRLASLARWALMVLDEETPAVLAARLAAEIREARRAQRDASSDVAGAHDWTWEAAQPSHVELQRRRGAA